MKTGRMANVVRTSTFHIHALRHIRPLLRFVFMRLIALLKSSSSSSSSSCSSSSSEMTCRHYDEIDCILTCSSSTDSRLVSRHDRRAKTLTANYTRVIQLSHKHQWHTTEYLVKSHFFHMYAHRIKCEYIYVYIYNIYTLCLKKPDTPVMSHNSSKNRTLSIIFNIINCPSMLDTLP